MATSTRFSLSDGMLNGGIISQTGRVGGSSTMLTECQSQNDATIPQHTGIEVKQGRDSVISPSRRYTSSFAPKASASYLSQERLMHFKTRFVKGSNF